MAWEPDYITGAELAAYVRTASDDPYVATLATAASRAVDGWCNRQFGQLEAPAAFSYDGCDAARLPNGRWLLEIDDVGDTTGLTVTVDGSAVALGANGYQLWPVNAAAKGGVYTHVTLYDRPRGTVEVLAPFGWPEVPAQVITATRLQGSRWHVRRESPYGTAGQPSEGTELSLSSLLDPDVRAALRSAKLVRARRPR